MALWQLQAAQMHTINNKIKSQTINGNVKGMVNDTTAHVHAQKCDMHMTSTLQGNLILGC